MRPISKAIGQTVLTVVFSMGLTTMALASSDRTVYDKPDVQPAKIIKGVVVNVEEKDRPSQRWDVSVKDRETGEVVVLHLDKRTTRKANMMNPDLGDYVIASYNEQNNYAYSFLTDARSHN
ncbi:MAG: hypothetical protein A4E19_03660 [Nitrospira sp. SG-bin1]|nr:MAG: hypothetical protein A4E19_03660 [Nitrospira sp. SG-bin1]